MTLPLRRFLYCFTLKQGTILIAILELLLFAFGLFLLLLGCANTQEIATILEADIEDSAQRQGIVLSSEDWSDDFNLQNEVKLAKAQHLNVVVLVGLYIAVALFSIHLLSCMLLLYGAIMRCRHLLYPWLCIVMFSLVFWCTTILVSMFLAQGYKAIGVFLIGSVHIAKEFFLWLTVYSYYRELGEKELNLCIEEHRIKKHIAANKPYNV
uniref:Uncharacterized protein n=1 Tax=Clastoptera arizonana TaxID=38151 RepID=A0A1B6CX95_9HEMI